MHFYAPYPCICDADNIALETAGQSWISSLNPLKPNGHGEKYMPLRAGCTLLFIVKFR
jgi:hypothetical protein